MKNELVNQPTSEPTEKTKAVLIFGAVVTAIVGICSAAGFQIPETVSDNALTGFSALMTVGAFAVAYFKKNKVQDV
jgi:hypothetical protein